LKIRTYNMNSTVPIRMRFGRVIFVLTLLWLCGLDRHIANAQAAHAPAVQAEAAAVPASAIRSATLTVTDAMVVTNSEAANLHLVIGRSIFFKTTRRLRRVYVSNPVVLQSFISSPNEVVISAKAAGVSSLALWDTSGHQVLYTVSADVDIEALRRSLALSLPGEDVAVRSQEGRVYLSGTVVGDDANKEALLLAGFYSKDVVSSLVVSYVHPKQVQLKVRIAEIDRTKLAQFGVNFFSTGSKMSSISTQQFSSVGLAQNNGQAEIGLSSPLNMFLYDAKLNVGMTIADLEAHNVLQILAEPTITTISGQEASFLSGGEFPYPVIQGGGGSFASVTIMFQPYGVKLKFTPQVNADGTIYLKVAPEVSALDYTNAVTISGYTIPAISTRRAVTEVELRDGESFSISGLLDHRTTVLLSKVPGIGNVPVLGELFKSKNNSHSVEELVVIVTATVVDPLHETPHPVTPKMAIPFLKAGKFDDAVHEDPNLQKVK
jgi:pilus assembly protein CpaC